MTASSAEHFEWSSAGRRRGLQLIPEIQAADSHAETVLTVPSVLAVEHTAWLIVSIRELKAEWICPPSQCLLQLIRSSDCRVDLSPFSMFTTADKIF